MAGDWIRSRWYTKRGIAVWPVLGKVKDLGIENFLEPFELFNRKGEKKKNWVSKSF